MSNKPAWRMRMSFFPATDQREDGLFYPLTCIRYQVFPKGMYPEPEDTLHEPRVNRGYATEAEALEVARLLCLDVKEKAIEGLLG